MLFKIRRRHDSRTVAKAEQAGRRLFRRAAMAFAAGALMTTTAFAQSTLEAKWQTLIDETRRSAELMGLGGAVMIDGEIVARGASGRQRKGSKLLVTTANKWHIGSVTKPMTATMIARLVEAGDLNWTDTPLDIFGESLPKMEIDPAWGEVTLEHLLNHTSGAAPNLSLLDNLKWPETAQALRAARLDVVRRTLASPPVTTPGEINQYSNLGYVLAGVMAGHAAGESWENLMRAQVFEPLGLKSAGFGAPKGTTVAPEPWGHRKVFFMTVKFDPANNPDNSPIMGPAGTVHMSADDMLRFGDAHLRGLKGESKYLTRETFERLHTPRLEDYALGWVERDNRDWAGGPISWHNGSNTMWYSFLVLAPEKNLVMFTGTNDGKGSKSEAAIVKAITAYAAEIGPAAP